MKLKFKKQAYQTNAVEAVANCFVGQHQTSGIKYRIDPGLVKKGGYQLNAGHSRDLTVRPEPVEG
ncbi:MAG: hypothetical protein WCS87_15815 [Methylococcaceae bacterium]